jgi:sporulation protein YlmC with PRC-barrel domain
MTRALGAAACCAAFLFATPSGADEKTAKPEDGQKILAAQTFRASKLDGMNVRNMEGEVLGSVSDLVVDVKTGKVQYVAMSVGDFLGLGGKLLAVPFAEFKFDHGQDEQFFVLDMSKEKIAAAPGFDKDAWPNFADPKWAQKIDQHYRKTQRLTGDETPATPREERRD